MHLRWLCLLSWMALGSYLASAETGEALYRIHCSPCHGVSGEGGKGPALALARLQRAPDDVALSSIITAGIPGSAMPGTRMTSEENRQLTAHVRALGARPAETVSGNPEAGAALFWGRANCGQCHAVGARGGLSGPDLTDIGAKRGSAHLRQSLLDPLAEIPDNFAVYRKTISIPDNYLYVALETQEGTRIGGVRMNEDSFSIQLRDSNGALRSFRKSELRRLEKEWGKSRMPSYRGVLTPGELDDVVAYLVSLTGVTLRGQP